MRIPYKGAGVALFYSEDSEIYILLGKRSDHPFHNRWSVPGGYYIKEINENSFDNANRELLEETGIVLNNLSARYEGTWTKKLPFFEWTTYLFSINEKINNLKPNEFYELKWINIKELKNYKLRPYTKDEINAFCINHR